MLAFITAFLQALAGWFKTKSEDQLIELGEKRNQENVDKAEREAQIKAKEEIAIADAIRADAANLSDDFLLPPNERGKQ